MMHACMLHNILLLLPPSPPHRRNKAALAATVTPSVTSSSSSSASTCQPVGPAGKAPAECGSTSISRQPLSIISNYAGQGDGSSGMCKPYVERCDSVLCCGVLCGAQPCYRPALYSATCEREHRPGTACMLWYHIHAHPSSHQTTYSYVVWCFWSPSSSSPSPSQASVCAKQPASQAARHVGRICPQLNITPRHHTMPYPPASPPTPDATGAQ